MDILLNGVCINRNKTTLYVIGNNGAGQLGLHNQENVRSLISWNKTNPNIIINNISTANRHTIFTDIDNNNWVAGYNRNGQCGLGTNEPYITKCIINDHLKNIYKICVNISSHCTFWITSKYHKLYGNGYNLDNQLGLQDGQNCNKPSYIDSIFNCTDIKSGSSHSIALSKPSMKDLIIIKYWLRTRFNDNYTHHIFPSEIIEIIQLFRGDKYRIYSTGSCYGYQYGQNGQNSNCKQIKNAKIINTKNETIKTWQIIERLKDVEINKIGCGSYHSLFLETNGNLWSCGNNEYGQCGDNKMGLRHVYNLKRIKYFEMNKIVIIDFCCGFHHNLAICNKGLLYSWGKNDYGQCGDGQSDKNIYCPKENEFFKLRLFLKSFASF